MVVIYLQAIILINALIVAMYIQTKVKNCYPLVLIVTTSRIGRMVGI